MDEQQGKEKKKRKKNNITYRSPVDGLLKAINLPNMFLQISDASMQGGVTKIILSLRRPRFPRAVPRRVNFRKKFIRSLIGYCISALTIFYASIYNENEVMKWEKKALLISLLLAELMLMISMIEMSLHISRGLGFLEQERRLFRLAGRLQEGLIVIFFVAMAFGILRTPVLAPAAMLFPT